MSDVQSLMELNREEVLQQLQHLEERGSGAEVTIPELLDEYLKFVAKTGDVIFPWTNVKPLLRRKVELVLDEFHDTHPMPASVNPPFQFEELKREIISSLESFTGAPFTIQRICELLTLPTKHYQRTDKFMRGLEKNVLVVSHVDVRHANSIGDRPASPQRSIFAPDTSFHVFERSINHHSDHSAGPAAGPSSSSSSNAPIDDSFRSGSSSSSTSRDSYLLSDQQPGTSSSSSTASSSSSNILLPSMSCPNPQAPAPLQQLDSFTTVFSSPPSTPLAVVSNMPPFDPTSSSSSSSSSESSGGSSPHPDGEPASPPENAEGHSSDSRSSFSSSSDNSQSNLETGNENASSPAPLVNPIQETVTPPPAETLVDAAASQTPENNATTENQESTETSINDNKAAFDAVVTDGLPVDCDEGEDCVDEVPEPEKEPPAEESDSKTT